MFIHSPLLSVKKAILKLSRKSVAAKFTRAKRAWAHACKTSGYINKVIEGLCIIIAFAIAAKLTSTLDLIGRFIDQNFRMILTTTFVSLIIYPFIRLICDMAYVFLHALFATDLEDRKSTP